MIRAAFTATRRACAARAAFAGLVVSGCGGGLPDAPPPPPRPPAPAPFPAGVTPGIRGHYEAIGGAWSYDARAYSDRFQRGLDRVVVLAFERVRIDAFRIVVQPGYGPPFQGHENELAIVEIEAYDRREPERYVRAREENALAVRGVEVDADAHVPGHGPALAIDGRLAAHDNEPHFRSGHAPRVHWFQARLPHARFVNQVVLHWPLAPVSGLFLSDPEIPAGLAPAALDVQVHEPGAPWRTLAARAVGSDGEHDADLLAELLGLDASLAGRLSHLTRTFPARAAPAKRRAGRHARIDDGWTICVSQDAPDPVRIGADELRDALARAGVGVGVVAGGSAGARTISIGRMDELAGAISGAFGATFADSLARALDDPDAHAVLVASERIFAVGVRPLSVRYAACRIEELLEREGAVLAAGIDVHRPVFRPRAVSSATFGEGGPDRLGFPEPYLSRIVHAYASALYVFQNGPFMSDATSVVGTGLDPTVVGDPGKRARLEGLIRRAKRHGLDVYWNVVLPGALPPEFYTRHPDIRGKNPKPHVICLSTPAGRRFVTDAVDRLVRAFPDLGGLVLLRSELSHTCGGRLACPGCAEAPGPDPAQAIFSWALEARDLAGSDVEIVAFDWREGGLPAVDESALPPEIGFWTRPAMRQNVPENDIRVITPSPALRKLLRSHDPRRRIWIEGQPSYAFPLHTQPDLPVPELFWEKWTRIRALVHARGDRAIPPGFGMGNGAGFVELPMVELGLQTLLWDPIGTREEEIDQLARNWYGDANVPAVRAAWRLFSSSFRQLATFDKYALRISPARGPGEALVDLPGDQRRALRALIASWTTGVRLLADATDPADARAMLATDLAEAALVNLRGLDHAASWTAALGDRTVEEISGAGDAARAFGRELIGLERENHARFLTLALRRPELRTHPYYRNWYALPILVRKSRYLDAALERLR